MRPKRLQVAAFGPFAGEVEVDFDAFHGDALFLIEGPTGVGKTSLLDAMCFALYGEVPGARNETGVALRSVHAAAGLRTEVTFTFVLGAQSFRVIRTPAQDRPKKRGKGWVTEAATAQLDRCEDGAWIPWVTNVKEVRGQVEALLGLSCEQFKQVLLMPQGEFREFLVAPSDKKEALLEKLFGTSTYGEVTVALAQRRDRLAREGSDARKRRDGVLEGAGVQSVEALAAQRDALAERAPTLALAVEGAQVTLLAARRAHDEARALHAAAAVYLEAKAEKETLEARRPELERLRQQLAQAQRAEPVLQVAAHCRRLEREAHQRDAALELVRAQQATAEARLARCREAASRGPELEQALETLRTRLHELQGLVRLEERLEVLARGRDAAQAARVEEEETLAQRRREAEALEEAQTALNTELAAVEDAQARRTQCHAERVRLEAQLHQRRQLEETRQAYKGADDAAKERETRLQALRRRLEAAQSHLDAGRRAREAGLAQELAAGLVPGKPCPVCGGHEHPAPAEALGERVTPEEVTRREADVQDARQRVEAAQEALSEARTTLEGLKTRGTALREGLGDVDEAPLATWEARVEDARGALREAEAAELRQRTLRERLKEVEASRRAAQEALTGARVALERATREREHAEATFQEVQAELDRKLPEGGKAGAQLIATRTQEAALQQERLQVQQDLQAAEVEAREAQTTLRTLEAERTSHAHALKEALEALEETLAARGFDSVETAQAQARPEPERERMQATLDQLEAALERATGRLTATEAALAGADPTALPELAPLQAALAGADDALEALKQEQAEATVQRRALEKSLKAIAAYDAAFAEADEALRVVGRLADALAGKNDRRMNLQRFVLASRVDEVALLASEQLLRMSRGRYALVRTDEVRHKGRGAGLDLMVRDHEVGQDRYVHSLSGGEMFLASLSLALGLAEVVARRRGAIRMDALFIDEGFGTLDDETLDLVMRTLEDLRLGGRLVGIISHVSELKQRIPAKISVRRTAGGSGSAVRVVA